MKPKPLWSLLHATYGRPEKAVAAMKMAIERASNPANVEYIFAVNIDDQSSPNIVGHGSLIIASNFRGSAQAWDDAASASTGEVMIQMQDDLELPDGWDNLLTQRLVLGGGMDWPFKPLFVAVGDGYRRDDLCCTAIMNRAYYAQKGEFLHPGYISVFSDDDVTYRALRDECDGLCKVIRARDLIFRHRHHYHDKSVPDDATYRRENSAEAYRIGGALFAERNPLAATDGLRTWQ